MKKHTILASLIALGSGSTCSAINPSYEDPTASVDMSMSAPDLTGLTNTGCTASTTYSATQIPAAMLVVLDKSSSMSDVVTGGFSKWDTAAQAIVQAIDQDVFDSMSLGL